MRYANAAERRKCFANETLQVAPSLGASIVVHTAGEWNEPRATAGENPTVPRETIVVHEVEPVFDPFSSSPTDFCALIITQRFGYDNVSEGR